MTSRLKKTGYTAIASLGLLAGTATIAAATSAGSSQSNRPTTTESAGDSHQDESPAYTGSVTAPEQDGGSEADEAKSLEALATISPDQASAAAASAVPGTVDKVELDNENGSVAYSVEIQTANGTVDVKIDAGNGDVLAQEAEEDDEGELGDDRP